MKIGVIGSGFAGLGAAIRLQQAGFEDFVVFERAEDIGGTWRDNDYPGCACDIPSNLYSFSFARNPDWTRMYPQQPEIWAYLRRLVKEHGLRRRIRFNAEVRQARFDEAALQWVLRLADGSAHAVDILISATGPLSKPLVPEIAGRASFPGPMFHSAQWRHDVDLTGKRVAVVGTGASAIQFVPEIARVAAQVHVFQRTPPWVLPRRDRAFGAFERWLYRNVPLAQRLLRWAIYLRQEALVVGFLGGAAAQRRFRGWCEGFLRREVADPELRRRITPEYAPGCKRVLVSNDWYSTLRRPNVELIPEAVCRFEGERVIGAAGSVRAADVVIFGTGFAATDFLSPMKVYGRGARELSALWRDGAATHLGISVAGFPNFFLLVGPNTGLGHNSIVFMIEAQLNYVLGALKRMRRASLRSLEVRPEVQERSYREVQQRMKRTVWASGCRSWYLTPDGRNDTLWPGTTPAYWLRTLRFDAASYLAA